MTDTYEGVEACDHCGAWLFNGRGCVCTNAQLDRAQGEVARLKRHCDELQQTVAYWQQQADSATIEALETRCANLRTERDRYEDAGHRLTGKLEAAQARCNEAEERWIAASDDRDRYRAMYKDALDRLAEVVGERDEAQARCKELEAERDEAVGQNKQARDVLRKIRKLAGMDVNEGRAGWNTSTIYNLAEELLDWQSRTIYKQVDD